MFHTIHVIPSLRPFFAVGGSMVVKRTILNEPMLPQDRYLDVRLASRYTRLSVRTLRYWMADTERPLPHFRVGGKILLRRSEIDAWLEGARATNHQDLEQLIDGVIREIANKELGGQSRKVAPVKRQRPGVENGCGGVANRAR